jgi:flagellar protein FliO/FliZ
MLFMFLKKFLLVLLTSVGAVCFLNAADSDTTPPAPVPQEQSVEAPTPAPYFAPPAPEPLPSSEEMTTSYESAFVRMLVTLLGLVVLIFGTFWVLRRLGKGKFNLGSGGRSINILEKRPLSPKSMLYLVEIDGKRVLISESQLEVRTIVQVEREVTSEEEA